MTNSERASSRRSQLKEAGKCIDCGREDSIGSVRCALCTEHQRSSNKHWRETHKDALRISKNAFQKRPDQLEKRRKWRKKYRGNTLSLYGGQCVCCHENQMEFLQFDHVNKDGKLHRQRIGRGLPLLRDLRRCYNAYKDSIRVLCSNCHNAITSYGVCPHVTGS